MKKTVLLFGLMLLMLPLMSQSRKYRKAMRSAIETMHKAPDAASETELAAVFEEIALSYPDQWLPSYYAGRILINNSFSETDMETKEALLERAKKSVDRTMELAPEESEAYVLESLYYLGLMSMDPEALGPVYYQDALYDISRSKTLDPENPRAWYTDGIMTLNMPEFIGGGPEAAKPIFQTAVEKFEAFESDDPFWPVWGEDLTRSELERLSE